MQSPEVCNFTTSDSLFNVETFEGYLPFNNFNINKFHYQHLLSVIVPEENCLLELTKEYFLNNYIFYKIYDLSPQDLADVKFISGFIRNGKVTLLCINERIDCDASIGVTPDSKLHLSLHKETYQYLGIEGIPSHFTKKLGNKYIVTIDLGDEKLLSNKTKLEKLKSCLKTLKRFTVLISWQPPEEEICPSSIARFFVNLGYKVQQCSPTFHLRTVNERIPTPNLTVGDKFDTLEFVEWLGMVTLGCDLRQDSTNYLSSYVAETDSSKVKQVSYFQLQGFFSSNDVLQIIKKIANCIKNLEDKWIAIYVQGFSDSPVSWDNEEQHFFTNGDNGYILIFNKQGGLICTQKCSKRRYK